MKNRKGLDLVHSDAYHNYGERSDTRTQEQYAANTPSRGRGHNRPMNFEEYAADGNRFINLVAWELVCTRNEAARITRSVLHALRDRLPADDSVQFAQGLPMMLKAIYFDQYDISRTPVMVRKPSEFLDMVYFNNRQAAVNDFPTEESLINAVRGVFRVLENTMDIGQVDQVKRMLNREIVEMIDGY